MRLRSASRRGCTRSGPAKRSRCHLPDCPRGLYLPLVDLTCKCGPLDHPPRTVRGREEIASCQLDVGEGWCMQMPDAVYGNHPAGVLGRGWLPETSASDRGQVTAVGILGAEDDVFNAVHEEKIVTRVKVPAGTICHEKCPEKKVPVSPGCHANVSGTSEVLVLRVASVTKVAGLSRLVTHKLTCVGPRADLW
jgi:hypothetical protein